VQVARWLVHLEEIMIFVISDQEKAKHPIKGIDSDDVQKVVQRSIQRMQNPNFAKVRVLDLEID
jgi:hypothetical protein